ncbi:MAG TPA: PDZ domain-containing protein [Gammaproteobacteria bacterium]|nr:PDZ domain-containing protein [Gammaproteobacteria bacterium]
MSVEYSIIPCDPAAHLFQVNCRIAHPDPAGQVVSLPAWIPGSYLIRDFARNITSMHAESGGKPLQLQKLDKDSWRCPPGAAEILIEYRVYAWDLSVRTAYLDTRRAYFNGSSVFLRVHGQEQRACAVKIAPPPGAGGWKVATAMTQADVDGNGFGRYTAADYDELIDHPVEIGAFASTAFEACGVRHEIALSGTQRCDLDRLASDLKRLCEYQIRFFGEPAPMERYVFLIMALGEGYGGLEHRASCSLVCNRDKLPLPGKTEVDNGYREFLGLCSHEYFHLWNVKRIKPAAFTPYDLQRENYTELLWAFEGITSYYDDLMLLRSGLINADNYLELLGRAITRVYRGKGRLNQTLVDSSFYAWTKFYKPDENSPNAIVSYYAKGALVALCLDMKLRQLSNGAKSLDDVMRLLWRRYGAGVGVPETGIEAAASETAGQDLSPLFDRLLRSTEELPLQEFFNTVGIECCFRAPERQQDQGGQPGRNANAETRADLGALFRGGGQHPELQTVVSGGAAHQAGLSAGDVLLAVDGIRLTASEMENVLQRYKPGDQVMVHAFRRDELLSFSVRLQAPEKNVCYLRLDSSADAVQLQHRKGWFSGGAE